MFIKILKIDSASCYSKTDIAKIFKFSSKYKSADNRARCFCIETGIRMRRKGRRHRGKRKKCLNR